MKTFKKLISEVAQPKSADEQRFKDKHEIEVFDHPVAFDHQFTGRIEKEPRIADYTDGEDEMVYEGSVSGYDDPTVKIDGIEYIVTEETPKYVELTPKKKSDGKKMTFTKGSKEFNSAKRQLDSMNETKQMDRMKIVSKSFDSRPPAERENDRLVGSKKASQQSYVERIDGKFYVVDLKEATEADLDPNKKIVVQGVKGMKSTSFTKKFRNMKAFDKWADSDAAGDFEIQYVMNESLEEAAKVTYKWYSVKDWKDGDKRYDGIDDLHGEMEDKKFGIIKWGADSPRSAHKDYHLAIPVANVKAIRYMDSNAKTMDMKESAIKRAIANIGLNESKMPYVVIDTANDDTVVAMASDEKDAKRSINTSELPPMKIKDKRTLKIVKTNKKQNIGQPLTESKGAFVIKAAVAKQNKKKKFEMGDKEYPVTIKDKNAKKIMDEANIDEAFKAGTMKMDNGDKVKVSKQDAKLLNQMIDDLNPMNKKEMMKVAMLDKNGFEEIVGFAREAL
jgi:hypothetical protein